ncbi:MAG: hypothetical protein H6703_05070 [Myxococcales bacterium]|nr:hypothetical protein [Myxococcales bacterium]
MRHIAFPLTAALLGVALLAGCDDPDAATSDAATPDAGPADAAPDATTPDAAPLDAADPDATPDATPDAAPPTPAPLGYRRDDITYTPTGDATPRTIPLFWWYPAADRAPFRATYRLFVADGVYVDAPPDIPPGAPLMVFSHGRSGFAQYSHFIPEHFARQGWVVIAPDHIGDTVSDAQDTPAIYRHRPEDLRAAIDFAQNPPAGHPLAGAVGDTVVLTGHSFGGYTLLALAGADYAVDHWLTRCAELAPPPFCGDDFQARAPLYRQGFRDPRVDLAIPMAPGNYDLFGEGLAAVDVPVLLFTADRDASTTDALAGDPIWDALPSDPRHRRVRLRDGGHFSFTVLCPVIGPLGRGNGCDPDNIAPADAHAAVLAYMDAFIDRHLHADETGAPLLDGDITLRDDVTLEAKP